MKSLSHFCTTVVCLVIFNKFCVDGISKRENVKSADELSQEFSGDNSLEIGDDEDESSRQHREILLELDLTQFVMRNGPGANIFIMDIFQKALSRYSSDLLEKLSKGQKNKISIGEAVNLFTSPPQMKMTIKLRIQCDSNRVKPSECKLIVREFEENFNVNELLRYWHEYGFSEVVNKDVSESHPTPDDGFYFISHSDIPQEAEDSSPIALPDFDDGLIPHHDPSDEYDPMSYDVVDSQENIYSNFTDEAVYDLLVNRVRQQSENDFLVEAYLMQIYNYTDRFRETFKSYVESSFAEFNHLAANNSAIEVNLLNATNTEFNNETLIWFELKTFNLEIKIADLQLDNNSIFDQIFDTFDLDEFQAILYDSQDGSEENFNDEVEIIKIQPAETVPTSSTESTTTASTTESSTTASTTETMPSTTSGIALEEPAEAQTEATTLKIESSSFKPILKHLIPTCDETFEPKNSASTETIEIRPVLSVQLSRSSNLYQSFKSVLIFINILMIFLNLHE